MVYLQGIFYVVSMLTVYGCVSAYTFLVVSFFTRLLLAGRMAREIADAISQMVGLVAAIPSLGLATLILQFTRNDMLLNTLAVLVICFAVLGSLIWLVSKKEGWASELKGARGEAMVAAELKRTGLPHLNDLYVEDGDDITQIDHVVLAGGTLVVIETKNYDKPIFASPGDTTWTAQYKKETEAEANPQRQNRWHITILSRVVGGSVPIEGVVVVMNFAEFPKWKPSGVIKLKELSLYLAEVQRSSPASDQADQAWQVLTEIESRERDALKNKHRSYLVRQHVVRGDMLASPAAGTGPAVKVEKPLVCRECGTTNFTIVLGRDTPYVWQCGTPGCRQWHKIQIGDDYLRQDGAKFYRIKPDGSEELMFTNPAPAPIPARRYGLISPKGASPT